MRSKKEIEAVLSNTALLDKACGIPSFRSKYTYRRYARVALEWVLSKSKKTEGGD